MKKSVALVVAVLAMFFSTACEEVRGQKPEISFCNTEYEYSVRKEGEVYELRMKVGKIHPWYDCGMNNPRRDARLSVVRRFSSKEEALKLMEESRKQYIVSKNPPVKGK